MEEFRAAHQRMFGLGQLKSIGKLAKLCEGDEKESDADEEENSTSSNNDLNAKRATNLPGSESSSNATHSRVPLPPPPPPANNKRLITFSSVTNTEKSRFSVETSKSMAIPAAGPVITNELGETVKILRTSIPSKKGPAPPPPIKKTTNSFEVSSTTLNEAHSNIIINNHNNNNNESSEQLTSNQSVSIKVNLQLPTN